jgi:hypothetical protein
MDIEVLDTPICALCYRLASFPALFSFFGLRLYIVFKYVTSALTTVLFSNLPFKQVKYCVTHGHAKRTASATNGPQTEWPLKPCDRRSS